ncbi:hypothetical protein ACFWIJ_01515 [Streptomyces sp. NPDC127079]|uniref:hypothetical protein n=1 Tax=Streptomyces sp. NPDC127079 TaxID=3347132 RepID=UPI003661ACD5
MRHDGPVGVQGDDGFSAAYTDSTGAVIHLCTDRPRHAGHHRYQVAKKERVVWLEAEGKVSAAVLGEPVRRGDLPTDGDGGRPDNSVPTPGL